MPQVVGSSRYSIAGGAVSGSVNEPVAKSKLCPLCFILGNSLCVDKSTDSCNGARVAPSPVVIRCASDGELISLFHSRECADYDDRV